MASKDGWSSDWTPGTNWWPEVEPGTLDQVDDFHLGDVELFVGFNWPSTKGNVEYLTRQDPVDLAVALDARINAWVIDPDILV